ncbi:Cysteine-rich secretory protein family [Popillia japonica]|uniref:Cysteine-rich secretory protein family n=1 Tax=Popillia japonica TaxID=7064 RepID=A0AAW1IDZ7_POPJA
MFDIKILTSFTIIAIVFVYHVNSCEKGQEIYQRGVFEDDIVTILKEHNRYRQNIMDGVVPGQPQGVGLNYLRWDEKLARTAQHAADKCIFDHTVYVDARWDDKCGQSLYRAEKPFITQFHKYDYNWTRVIEHWYLEVHNYTYGPIRNEDNNLTGHYTQLVWADTELVGCGYVAYENENGTITNNDVALLHVCHYGPPGNRGNYPPYELA